MNENEPPLQAVAEPYDFFDGPPEPVQDPDEMYWWQRITLWQRSKKLLYASSVLGALFTFVGLLLACITISSSESEAVQGTVAGFLAMSLLTLAAMCGQLVFFRSYDVIITI